MHKKKFSLLFYIIFLIIFLIFIVNGFLLLQFLYQQLHTKQLYSSIAEKTPADFNDISDLIINSKNSNEKSKSPSSEIPVENTDKDLEQEILKQYQKLYQQNSDFCGMLQIPNTILHYPVVMFSKKTDYLKTSFDGKANACGTPFLDQRCHPSDLSTVLIYGHHMKDGSMFGALSKYKDQSFYQKHRDITVCYYQKDQPLIPKKYRIFSVIEIKDSRQMPYPFYSFPASKTIQANPEAYHRYLKALKQYSLYETNAGYTDANRLYRSGEPELLLLSTCDYAGPDGRLLIAALNKN